MPNFPSDPYNGATVVEELPNGDLLIWTYDRPTNTWNSKLWEGGHDPGLIFTRDVQTTPSEIIEGVGQLVASEPGFLNTQEEVNDFVAGVAEKAIRATSRAADQVDFLQNSVGKGVWSSGEGVVDDDDEYPGPGEFWPNNTEFKAITKFKFNDSGLPGFTNPGSLEGTRVGDYLTVQTNDNNSFGQYVIKGLATENKGKAGLIIRTFDVALIRDARSLGDLSPLDRCSVTVARPMSVIVQDTQPVVSTRGIFWYRESDDHLLISNYADGFTGDGPQWTDLTAGAGGDYLPLTGGTITGELRVNKPNNQPIFEVTADKVSLQKHATSIEQLDPKEIINVGILDNLMRDPGQYGYLKDYLPLAGGTSNKMTGILYLGGNKIAGLGEPYLETDAATKGYVETTCLQLDCDTKQTIDGDVGFRDSSKLQMGGTYNNNIIDGTEGFTDNSIVATLGFVNHQIKSIGDSLEGTQNTLNIRSYKFVNDRAIMSLRPGELAFFDNQGEANISKPEDAFFIAFHGENKDGKRSVADGDAIDYESYLGGHISILNGDLTKTYMRVHGYGGIPSFTQINYWKDSDIYTIGWPDNMASPKVSTFTQFSNGQTVNLRIPDLFL